MTPQHERDKDEGKLINPAHERDKDEGIFITPIHETDWRDNVLTSEGAKGTSGQTGNVIKGFNQTESKIINEAQGILDSKAMTQIQQAHVTGQPVTVVINGRTIQYEPNLPASGMKMFGENGFLIGKEAFKSQAKLQKTILHELHRLNTSSSADGVSGALAAQETKAAFDFAEKASNILGNK